MTLHDNRYSTYLCTSPFDVIIKTTSVITNSNIISIDLHHVLEIINLIEVNRILVKSNENFMYQNHLVSVSFSLKKNYVS